MYVPTDASRSGATGYPGYYRDLSPELMRFALLLQGVELPSGPLNYLELGYGQGMSLNIHAAATSHAFWGTDGDPDQTVAARRWAAASGAEARLLGDSFVELMRRDDLPEFDIIALHDVWSWVNDDNRRLILDLLHSRLKMGGVAYVSYNTLPGWASLLPLRDLLQLHSGMLGTEAESAGQRLANALHFASTLAETGSGYCAATPSVRPLLEQLRRGNPDQAARAYLNKDWRPLYFADMAHAMGLAKLQFASSTRLLNQIDAISLPEKAKAALGTANNAILRETVRDYACNQLFRTDMFVKGAHRLKPLDLVNKLAAIPLSLTVQLEAVSMRLAGPAGAVTLNEELYAPCLTALADGNYAPKTLEQLEDHPLLAGMDSYQLTEIIAVLTGAGWLHPVYAATPDAQTRSRCAALNRTLCAYARSTGDIPWLASPVLGAGVASNRLEQLFLLSRADGGENPAIWAEDVGNILAGLGETLLRPDGTALTPDELHGELRHAAELFQQQRLPLLEALQAVPSAGDTH